jgi:L-fucose isomerase-like protein
MTGTNSMTHRAAFIPLARTTFDISLAEQVTQQARACLSEDGFTLIGPDQLVTDAAAAQAAADALKRQAVDVLIIFQATFADSTMVTALAEACPAPVFLWAIPEARTGGRLRLNSLCGINLAGHALTLRGRAYDYAYAAPGDAGVLRQLHDLAAAGMLVRRLKSARLGVVGEHPAGMDSCHLDAPMLHERLGVTVEQIALEQVFERARSLALSAGVQDARHWLDSRMDNLATLEQAPLNGTLSVYAALKAIAEEQHLDGLAVRCWPEFFTQMGCAGCGAMSMLSDGLGQAAPIPCSCEADINGTVTQLMLQWLAGAPAFGTDIVAMDFDEDVVALWHCGLAPLSMADPEVQVQGGIHSNRKVPLVFEFPLRPGQVTIARLSQSPGPAAENAAAGGMRLVLGRGEMLRAPKPFSGTSGTLRLERPARHFFDALMRQGLEHHVSLAYGDYYATLKIAAGMLNLKIFEL